MLIFAVEVGTSCFGRMCTGQVGIRTNFRPRKPGIFREQLILLLSAMLL